MQKNNKSFILFITITTISITAIILSICILATYKIPCYFNSNLADYKDRQKVEIVGYASPLLSNTKNYFYLTDKPYTTELSLSSTNTSITNVIPIYPDIETPKFIYTEQKIRVTGELLKMKYKDNNGYENTYRIINATYSEVPEYELTDAEKEYRIIANTGLYQDLYMYQGMFEVMATNPNYEEEGTSVNTEEIENMMLYLALVEEVSIENKEELASLINEEMQISESLNKGIFDKDLIFNNREVLNNYFEVYRLCGKE